MTLIELLVVIIIITTIVAAAIPVMAPADDDRRVREASRGLNTFITGAQARAIAANRPFGVAFKRLGSDTNTNPNKRTNPTADMHADNGVCVEVFYVEQAPPYAGFDANSRACVSIHPDPPTKEYAVVLVRFVTRGGFTSGLPYGWTGDLFPTGMIRPGDVIETGGTRFELLAASDDFTNIDIDTNTGYFFLRNGVATIAARPLNDSGQQINPRYDHRGNELGMVLPSPRPYWTAAAPYKILRQATPTSDEPYQLPEGVAVDLRASGVGRDDYFYVSRMNDNSQGVLIMFTPEGGISRVSYSQMPINDGESPVFDEPVVDNVYLLLGKRENIPAPDVSSDPTLSAAGIAKARTDEQRADMKNVINWLSSTSRWIVLGAQTGRIVTIENAFVDPSLILGEFSSSGESSERLRNEQILAAREFTREMAQMGGR